MPACIICGEALDDFNVSNNNPSLCQFCAGEADDDLMPETNEEPII